MEWYTFGDFFFLDVSAKIAWKFESQDQWKKEEVENCPFVD
jgi:hypothetical protein